MLDDPVSEAWPAPAPVPIGGARFDSEDTWMTFGLGVDGAEEDRTVTVVFQRPVEEQDATDEFGVAPFSPSFPGGRRR